MDLEQSIKDFTAMINTIKEKYDGILKKVQAEVERIDNIYNIYKDQSDEFIQKEIEKSKKKIDKWKKDAEKMLQEQTDKANEWLDGVKKDVEEQVQRAIKKILESML